ncbi:hypothetical protein ACJX0J_024512, partial [Zea mays]
MQEFREDGIRLFLASFHPYASSVIDSFNNNNLGSQPKEHISCYISLNLRNVKNMYLEKHRNKENTKGNYNTWGRDAEKERERAATFRVLKKNVPRKHTTSVTKTVIQESVTDMTEKGWLAQFPCHIL